MIILELLIKIYPDKRTEFIQAFEMIGPGDSAKKGCLERKLFEQVDNVDNFLWREQWENQSALDLYSQGEKFGAMMGAINILGTLIQKRSFTIKEEGEDV